MEISWNFTPPSASRHRAPENSRFNDACYDGLRALELLAVLQKAEDSGASGASAVPADLRARFPLFFSDSLSYFQPEFAFFEALPSVKRPHLAATHSM